MSVSPPALSVEELQAGSYFVSGKRLYFILDMDKEENYVLVEDCKTNSAHWWDEEFFNKAKKERVR